MIQIPPIKSLQCVPDELALLFEKSFFDVLLNPSIIIFFVKVFFLFVCLICLKRMHMQRIET